MYRPNGLRTLAGVLGFSLRSFVVSVVLLFLLLAMTGISLAQSSVLLPNGRQQFLDANGDPLGGGTVGMYVPSTLTFKNTWQDPGNVSLNTNPVVLDSGGTALIYGNGEYRQIVKDVLGVTIWDALTNGNAGPFPAWGGTSTGSANAQVAALSSFVASAGRQIAWRAGFTNTGSATLQVGTAGTFVLNRNSQTGPVPLSGGEIVIGNIYIATFDSVTGALIIENGVTVAFGGALTNLAGAATTDLGTIASHSVNVTGSGWTITSFGSTANIGSPLFFVKFAGTGTITYNGTSMLLPGQTSITVTAGDTALALYLGSGNWQLVDYQRNGTSTFPIFAQGRFARTSSTVATLSPYGGNLVSFPSGATATIPAAGIASTITTAYLNGVTPSALVANTLYFAYLWNSGTASAPAYVIDWSTTGHSTNTATGIETKTGDTTRVLVGMAYPQAGPVLNDAANARLVVSWNNKPSRQGRNEFTVDRTTTSATFVEINSEIRINFIGWGDETAMVAYSGAVTNSSSVSTFAGIALDGVSTDMPAVQTEPTTGTVKENSSIAGTFLPSEGFHYFTLMGKRDGGTATWHANDEQGKLSLMLN